MLNLAQPLKWFYYDFNLNYLGFFWEAIAPLESLGTAENVVEERRIPKSCATNKIKWFSLSAVVVENRDTWFSDDNGLTKELCADPQENEDEQPEINEPCCACDEAKYEV